MAEKGTTYSEKECARVFNNLFLILNKIHKKGCMLHNDLKHENFLLEEFDPNSNIVVADFGFATVRGLHIFELLLPFFLDMIWQQISSPYLPIILEKN